MAKTSTAVNACDVGIWLDNAGGTPTDIGGSSNQVTLSFDNELGEYRVFGDRWMNRTECGKDASFSLNIVYSTAADEGFDILKNWFFTNPPGNRTLTVYLPDKNVGSDRYQAEVKIDSWSAPAGAGEGAPIDVTLELLPDGEVTHSVAAT